MTFDSLIPNFGAHFTYTENGITMSGAQPGVHFHSALNSLNSTTAAFFGTGDGSPQNITYSGSSFTLRSVLVADMTAGCVITVTSSSGASVDIRSPGQFNFDPGFEAVSFARMTISGPMATQEYNVILDNIVVVPEPEVWIIVGLSCLLLCRLRRRTTLSLKYFPDK